MPHPKKKTTRGTGGQRRSHDHLNAVNTSNCPKCDEPKLAHRACAKCGFYKDNKVIDTEKAAARIIEKATPATEEKKEKKPAKKAAPKKKDRNFALVVQR